MLCPNCSNSEASILSSKLDSKKILITRKRHCLICGYKFETVEYPKKKIKKRKIEKRTEWQNFRFTFYIPIRFSHVMGFIGGPELERFKSHEFDIILCTQVSYLILQPRRHPPTIKVAT